MTLKQLLFPIIICLLALSSCTEELATTEFIEQTPEEKAATYLRIQSNDVLFAAITVNHNTNLVEGILVDKEANLRVLEMKDAEEFNFASSTVTQANLEVLYENSRVFTQIDPLETADLHRMSKTLNADFNYNESDESDESVFIISYELAQLSSSHSADGCGSEGGSHLSNSMTSYAQNQIKVTGKINYEAEGSSLIINFLESMWLDAAIVSLLTE